MDASTIELSQTVSQNQGQVSAEIDGEIVLMNLKMGNYYGLDDISSYIWRFLKEPVQVSKLCEVLASRYNASPDTIEHDVLAHLQKMKTYGLIDVASE